MKTLSIPAFLSMMLMITACVHEKPATPVDPTEGDKFALDSQEDIAAVWQDKYAAEGFESAENISYFKYFKNGEYVTRPDQSFSALADYRLEFYGKDGRMRHASIPDGFAVTVPAGMKPDYTLSRHGVRFCSDTSVLRITNEIVTPYTPDRNGYNIYITEWLDRYISNKNYLNTNGLRYEIGTMKENTRLNPGYEVTIYSIAVINGAEAMPFTHYRIAIVRKEGQYSSFGLLLYKSINKDDGTFDDIVASYAHFARIGRSANNLPLQEARPNPHWNAETKAYYDKLLTQSTLDFGVFSGSMPDSSDESFNSQHAIISSEKERLEGPDGIDHKFEIMPTYTHISWYSTKMGFPSEMAAEFAGGNGFNGKPVLQFTYQFTTNNNNVTTENTTANPTPMFDILRGKYDTDFHRLAAAIKAYGKPVLFRLNNEMNSDWTSYCGMMTLLDPDIFIYTWRYLYDLFEKDDVDNCIWIFNPIAVSCPYSRWGEDLAYYPGNDYVQLLGLTSYEFNNGSGPESFRSLYTKLYDKNADVFGSLPAIISEFACGSGGETSGELKRNKLSQAEWVRAMFNDLCARDEHPYIANIKGAVWFSCNDYSADGRIVNQLSLDSDLHETLEAFREGFSKLK